MDHPRHEAMLTALRKWAFEPEILEYVKPVIAPSIDAIGWGIVAHGGADRVRSGIIADE